MRKLNYTVGIDSISPDTAQFGGVQGEHNATDIEITLTDELVLALTGLIGEVYYRVDLVDGAGAHYIGEPIAFGGENKISYQVPQSATAEGGNAEVRLVFSEVEGSETNSVIYTFGMRLYFEPSFHGDETEVKAVADLSGLVKKASDCAESAERSAVLAKNASCLAGQSLEEIDEIIFDTLDSLKESGQFDGKDGKDGTPATHCWNGTVLTVASASGTSSADLKGEKGDKGAKGDTGSTGPKGAKGDKGDRGAPFTYADFTAAQLAALTGPKGDTGPQGEKGDKGEKGETGAQGIQGKPGLDWKGEWDATKNYMNGDIVSYNGSSYVCAIDGLPEGIYPGEDEQHWALLAEKGDKGDGYILTDEDKGEIAARVSGDFVSYSEDVSEILTAEQKETARKNIGAAPLEAWETIADITLEEAITIIKIDQDTNGQEFSLKRAKIVIDTDNTTSFYTATGTLIMGLLSAETGGSVRAMYLANFIPNTANKYSRAFFEIELVDGMAFVSGCCKNNLNALNNTEIGSSFAKYSNLPFAINKGIINDIRFTTAHKDGFAAGTHIKVLGVRA